MKYLLPRARCVGSLSPNILPGLISLRHRNLLWPDANALMSECGEIIRLMWAHPNQLPSTQDAKNQILSLMCKNQIFTFFRAFKLHISPRPNLILLPKCYCEIKTILGRLWGIFYFSDAGVWRQNGYNIFVERYGRFCQTIWLKSVKFVKFVSFVSFALVTWPDCDI